MTETAQSARSQWSGSRLPISPLHTRDVGFQAGNDFSCSPASVIPPLQGKVFPEEFQTLVPVYLSHISFQFVSPAENPVELPVAETYESVVIYSATVIDSVDICPHTGTQAHMARFSGSVQGAAGKVVGSQLPSRFPYCGDFSVGGCIIVGKDAVVSGGDHLSVFDYHGAEGAAVVRKYAFSGLFDGHSHESDIIFHHLFVNLYHTQPMYPATAGRNRLTMLITFRVNSEEEELYIVKDDAASVREG